MFIFHQRYCHIITRLLLLIFIGIGSPSFAQYEEGEVDSAYLDTYVPDTAYEESPLTIVEETQDEFEPPVFLNKEYRNNGRGGLDSISLRRLGDSVMADLRKDEAFWYVDYEFDKAAPKPKNKDRKQGFFEAPLGQTFLWMIIIGGFVAFVIIYLANSNIGLFRRRSRALPSDFESDVMPENIFEINYQKEIDKAIQNGDYRLATRLMFLRVLKNLSDKRIINYQQDRTNFDYLLQVHGTPHYESFFKLTRNYEYTWYGQFNIDREKFNFIKSDFEKFDQQVQK